MMVALKQGDPRAYPLSLDERPQQDATMLLNTSGLFRGLRQEYDENPTPNVIRFVGTAGQSVRVALQVLVGDQENVIKLYDPAGTFISESYKQYAPKNELVATLPVDGEYRFDITAYTNTVYQVSVVDAAYDLGEGLLMPGFGYGRVRNDFNINLNVNHWTFFGQAGHVVGLRLFEWNGKASEAAP